MALTEKYVTTTGTDTWANASSISTPASFATMLTNAASGERVNLKAGTYSLTTSTSNSTNSGLISSPIILRGYNSTIGDGYQGRSGNTGALVTTNMPVLSYTTGRFNFTNFWQLESVSINGATATTAQAVVGTNSVVARCKIEYTSTTVINALQTSTSAVVIDNDIIMSGASGGNAGLVMGNNSRAIGNRIAITSATAAGISLGNAAYAVVFNTIYGGIGITTTNAAAILTALYNTIANCAGDGINVLTGTTGLQCFVGNMITDNTGDGIDMVSTSNGAFAAYNRTRDNASGYANAGDWITASQFGDVTTDTGGASTDYTNAGSQDYTLIDGSPATNTAFPAYLSMGAWQKALSVALGGFWGGFFMH